MGEYDRIVDVYGASHYAPRLDQIIESYGKLLKPGGKAFLHVSEKIRLFVHNESGERIGIVEYLGAIEGMRVSDVRPNKRGGHSLTLTRTRERLRVPALEPKDFIYIEDLAPPIRKYRFKGGKTVINGRKRATMRRMRDKRSAPVTRQRRRVPRLRRSGPRR